MIRRVVSFPIRCRGQCVTILPGAVVRLQSRPATGMVEVADNDASEVEEMSILETCAEIRVWNDHSHTGIDPLALPRDGYVPKFDLHGILRYSRIIKDGISLDEGEDIQQLLEGTSDETVLTLANVHC